jgi:TolB-like protein
MPPASAEKAKSGEKALDTRSADAGLEKPGSMLSEKAAASAPGIAPSQSGLKAGYSDDNEQFNYFVKFLDQYKDVSHYELAIGERIAIKVCDSQGRDVANADIDVKIDGKTAASGRTYSDGSFYLYPLELGNAQAADYVVEAKAMGQSSLAKVPRSGPRSVKIALGAPRAVPSPLPVDVLFVLDTTGSMGEEIERLRSTIEIISANITALKPKPALRFGMVLYRDRDDEYDTKVVPFSSDLGGFQKALDEVSADGGGDDPEDLQSALRDAVGAMKWNADGIRLGFIITDAPPHLDYGQDFTYAASAREAKAKGIKLFSIGAGGLPLEGEYPLRQIAQYTQGKYIFLTYGEKGESEGGEEGSVSHHTGSNFATDKLEAIVIKFVRDEIARQSDRPLEAEEAYSDARKVEDESREETLSKLFTQALQDLSDYSSLRLAPGAKLAVMPLAAAEGSVEGTAAQAEYFGSQLSLAASKSKLFTVVERGNLQAVLGELELQLSGLADEGAAAKAGKLLGADFLVTGTVFRAQERYELFLKLVRVETAEVLAAAKARVDLKLGL